MQYIWTCTIEDILEAQVLARKHGKTSGQDYTDEFLEIMLKKGKSHLGATEFTKNELLQHLAEKNGTVLDISVDNNGKESYKIVKKIEPTP